MDREHPNVSVTSVIEKVKCNARTVEIIREEDENGTLESFGFTLWHGNPPVIGSVVPNSPADQVGLKSNLFVLSVNGESVCDFGHQQVANLIYNSPNRSVWLVVSESAKDSIHFKASVSPQARSDNTSKMSTPKRYSSFRSRSQGRPQGSVRGAELSQREAAHVPPSGACRQVRVFIHYLGPVEMPLKWSTRHLSLKIIRECVRRMISFRDRYLELYLQISGEGMSLINLEDQVLATYGRDELYYCGVHIDNDEYFGIVTRHHQETAVDPQVGQSSQKFVNHCHVFKVPRPQSNITVTLGHPTSPLKRTQVTAAKTSHTIVNYIRQVFRSDTPTTGSPLASPKSEHKPLRAVSSIGGINVRKVDSGATLSSGNSTPHNSPLVDRKKVSDLVDMRPPTEGSEDVKKVGDGPVDNKKESVEETESEPILQVSDMAYRGEDDIHVGSKLPPKNSALSSSVDSIMTATTAAETYDSTPQVGGWLGCFDRLLEDPQGVQCFQKFLKSEFSDENLKFWLDVEDYKSIMNLKERKLAAKRIFMQYVNPKAKQPVNLDGTVVEYIIKQLDFPKTDTFYEAQRQIYSLMKLDSYQRFRRSKLVQSFLMAEMDGKALPFDTSESDDTAEKYEEEDAIAPLPLPQDPAHNSSSNAREKEKKKSKEGGGWSIFGRRSRSFRSNSKPAIGFGLYSTNEKKKSKSVRDRGRVSDGSGAPPSLHPVQNVRGFQNQEESDVDHLAYLNTHCGPCFGVVLHEKVTKILPVTKGGTVRDTLSHLMKQYNLSFETADIRFAQTLLPVDLEAASAELTNQYLVIRQSLDFFQAIFPKKEVSVPADPNKTVQEVMEPILRESDLSPSSVQLYVFGARQPLKWSTYADLLKGQRVEVKTTHKTASGNKSNLSGSESHSTLSSSSGSLHQKGTLVTNASSNNNNGSEEDFDNLFGLINRLQSDVLKEQRSQAPKPVLTSSKSLSFPIQEQNKKGRTSGPPTSTTHHPHSEKEKAHQISDTLSGSQPSLFDKSPSKRSISPIYSLSQDCYPEPPFNVEVVATDSRPQAYRRHSALLPPPYPPPQLPWRSKSPPPPSHPPPRRHSVSPSPQYVQGISPQDYVRLRPQSRSSLDTSPSSAVSAHSSSSDSYSQLDTVVMAANHQPKRKMPKRSKGSSSSETALMHPPASSGQTEGEIPRKTHAMSVGNLHYNPARPPSSQHLLHPPMWSNHPDQSFSLSQPLYPTTQVPQWTSRQDSRMLQQKGERLLQEEFKRAHPSRKARRSFDKDWKSDDRGSMV